MKLFCLPALNDNYIWILSNNRDTVIIDPSTADPVIALLQQHNLVPCAILLTHHHRDHVGGVAELVTTYPNLPVYGPNETRMLGTTQIVKNSDVVRIGEIHLNVISTPGHTLGHVVYYSAPYLFCGDTLFSAGCGRIFEGTAEQMYESLQKIAQLPDDTLICCAHEYTLSNLRFAASILPNDDEINQYLKHVEILRAKNKPTVPTKLGYEKQINLFLRCNEHIFNDNKQLIKNKISPLTTFTELRHKKDCW